MTKRTRWDQPSPVLRLSVVEIEKNLASIREMLARPDLPDKLAADVSGPARVVRGRTGGGEEGGCGVKHVVLFSGGAASSYVAWLVAELYGREDTILLFNDTQAEHPDAYRFRREVAAYIGLPITEASSGESLWQCMVRNHALPSNRIPFCTGDLKLGPRRRYLKALDEPYILYNGFGPDEWRRVQRATLRAEANGERVRSPLWERGITDDEVKGVIREKWRIRLPQPYRYLRHNNCIPCYKAGKWSWYQVMRHYPEAWARAVEMEHLIGAMTFPYVTLEELAETWKRRPPRGAEEHQMALPCDCAG